MNRKKERDEEKGENNPTRYPTHSFMDVYPTDGRGLVAGEVSVSPDAECELGPIHQRQGRQDEEG